MSKKKQWLEAKYGDIDNNLTLDSLQTALDYAKLAQSGGQWKDLRLHFWGDDHEEGAYFAGKRLETDGELAKRLACAKAERVNRQKIAANIEAQERKEYERLKKKYDGT